MKSLDAWILERKNSEYDRNIQSNEPAELQAYSDSLEIFALRLIRAIEKESFVSLKELGWPEDLMECIKDVGIRVEIVDRIESWLIRYPFNRSKAHMQELQRENEGLE